MMTITALLLLFAACLLLGATTRRQWAELGESHESLRWRTAAPAWLLLALAVIGFGSSFGWEVGLAWLVLWFALAALLATVWVSLRPRSALWAGRLLGAAALVTWVLG